MQLSTIIPPFLLRERILLAVFCFFLRIVRPTPSKQIVDGQIVALRPYEACVDPTQVAYELRMGAEEVVAAIKALAEVDLLEYETLTGSVKVRFRYLVLPSLEGKGSPDVISDIADCWFDDYIREYLEIVLTDKAPRTHDNYEAILKAFSTWLGKKRLSELSPSDLERYKNKRKGTVSDQTINIHTRTLKAALGVATRLQKIKENPFRAVKLIRIAKKATPSLTKEQYPLLISTLKEPWLRDIVNFDILTGLRLGELANLRWSDVNLEKGVITIQSTPNYQVKHGKMRVLPLHPEARAILLCKEKAGEWVFLKEDGTRPPWQFISKKFKAYVRAAGLPEDLHFHSLRATFASWCANSGVSMYTLQNLMGHSSITVTESYTTPDQGSARAELAKISLETASSCPP